jgi:hypothetical protein
MSEQKQREVHRWVIPDGRKRKRLLVAAGRQRNGCVPIIIKALDRLNEHLTLVIKDDGTFNFHFTKEGNIHRQTRLAEGKIDLERLKVRAEAIYKKSLRPVNLKAKRLYNFMVLWPRNSESWNKFYWRLYEYKNRKMIYPDSVKLKEIEPTLEDYFDIRYFDELPKSPDHHSLPFGMYSNIKSDRFGVLFHDEKNYYAVPISEMIEALGEAFTVESIFCPRCGTKAKPSAESCSNCGKRFS